MTTEVTNSTAFIISSLLSEQLLTRNEPNVYD